MKYFFFIWLTIFSTARVYVSPEECGCKRMHECYETMLQELKEGDEVSCIENASTGSSTVTIFLQALAKYCSKFINVSFEHVTSDGRRLYEVLIEPESERNVEDRPTFIIDAGQEAGTESVQLVLYVIEQLTACAEYFEMIRKVRWVILPSVNPDGMEHARYRIKWRKNYRPTQNGLSVGIDISRNFDMEWSSCQRSQNIFSPTFPGTEPNSENETIFIKNVLDKHVKNTKIYLSVRRNGHSIGYPHAYSKTGPSNANLLEKVAGEVALRVNQRTSGIHLFANNSIYELEGRAHCGHSVDYAFNNGVPLAFEMRVFLASDNEIMSMFQSLPSGYEASLRNGYFNGIRELYNAIVNHKKYGKLVK